MKVLVAVKRVVDSNVKVRVRDDESGVELAGVRMGINPFDEVAVEQAVRWKEQGVATEVVCVSCGVAACAEALRTAMAMGADRAVLVETDPEFELLPLHVAKLLLAVIRREQAQLVLLGKQAVDDDCNQTGQMLAALLGWPQATFASGVEMAEGRVRVRREIDGGSEILSMPLPAVITADLRLNEPRYVTLPNIMKARKKALATLRPAELGVELRQHVQTLRVAEPAPRAEGVRVADAAALIDVLKAELSR
ncbi:electron transfer flavoprotein subunit beta/FixA family protein [Thiomonas sp. FB-6]|uniref:electron transfer flavoprotein subunit beta/FixA family protein n=1 Tax=Thiomonas sp. FB-6 TaxID=1158291 RepID=UPI00037FD89B|nr:electron transfer flavoprotein subunit beta/FixA family protein [Thiomonas sp. FB-6]